MKKLIFPAVVLIALCFFNTAANAQLTQTYVVTNNSGMVVTGVSLSPNDANNWGLNLNASGNILMDKTFEFKQAVDKNNCVYDIRYTGEDGKYYYVQDVNLCTTTNIVLTKPDTKNENKTDDNKTNNDKLEKK
jgi:hypothetical protein